MLHLPSKKTIEWVKWLDNVSLARSLISLFTSAIPGVAIFITSKTQLNSILSWKREYLIQFWAINLQTGVRKDVYNVADQRAGETLIYRGLIKRNDVKSSQ